MSYITRLLYLISVIAAVYHSIAPSTTVSALSLAHDKDHRWPQGATENDEIRWLSLIYPFSTKLRNSKGSSHHEQAYKDDERELDYQHGSTNRQLIPGGGKRADQRGGFEDGIGRIPENNSRRELVNLLVSNLLDTRELSEIGGESERISRYTNENQKEFLPYNYKTEGSNPAISLSELQDLNQLRSQYPQISERDLESLLEYLDNGQLKFDDLKDLVQYISDASTNSQNQVLYGEYSNRPSDGKSRSSSRNQGDQAHFDDTRAPNRQRSASGYADDDLLALLAPPDAAGSKATPQQGQFLRHKSSLPYDGMVSWKKRTNEEEQEDEETRRRKNRMRTVFRWG